MHGEAQRCEASVRDLPAQRANATPTSQRLPTCAPDDGGESPVHTTANTLYRLHEQVAWTTGIAASMTSPDSPAGLNSMNARASERWPKTAPTVRCNP